MAGTRRLRPRRDSRVTLSVGELERLWVALDSAGLHPDDLATFRAVFTLAFTSCCAPENFCSVETPSHTIRLHHVVLRGDHLSLTIHSSKTSSVPLCTSLHARHDLRTCPVRALRHYLSLRLSQSPVQFLFISNHGRPITTKALIHTMRRTGSIGRFSWTLFDSPDTFSGPEAPPTVPCVA